MSGGGCRQGCTTVGVIRNETLASVNFSAQDASIWKISVLQPENQTRRSTEIFQIDASWAEKLTETRVSFLVTPTVMARAGYWKSILVSQDICTIKMSLFGSPP